MYVVSEWNEWTRNLESAIKIIRAKDEMINDHRWKSVEKGLEWIQIYASFVPEWSDVDKVVNEKVGDVARSIADAFKTAQVDIETAIGKGDDEVVDELVKKIEVLKPRIREAYNFFSDYVFDQSTSTLIVIPRSAWYHFGDLFLRKAERAIARSANKPLFQEFPEVLVSLFNFGSTGIMFVKESHDGIASLVQGVIVCLACLLFLWCEDEMDGEGVTVRISDLLQRIRPISLQVLNSYTSGSSSYGLGAPEVLETVVRMAMPANKKPLPTLVREGLHYMVEQYRVKLLGSDIQKLFTNAVSLHYSYLLAAQDNDELLLQLVRYIELLKAEFLFKHFSNQFESIYNGLSSAQAFLNCAPDIHSKRLAFIFNRIKEVVSQGKSLYLSSPKSEELRKAPLSDAHKLYIDFKVMKIQAFLVEQVRCTPCLMVLIGEKFHALNEALELLSKYASLLPFMNHGDEELVMAYAKRLDEEETPPSYISQSDQLPQQFINELSDYVPSLLERVHSMNSEIQYNFIQFQTSLVLNFPMTHLGLGFLDVFLEKLSGLLTCHADHIWDSLKQLIEAAMKELKSFRSFFLMEVERKRDRDPELNNVRERVKRVIYETDYIIDHVLLVQCNWNHMMWLCSVIDEMQVLNSELTKFVQMENNIVEVHGAVQTSMQIKTQTTAPQLEESLLSLEDQENMIIDRLTAGRRREIITISGMAGIGKTTLAKKVYDNPQIKNHFHKRAWCCVSQECQPRELLLKILSDIIESSTDEIEKKTVDELLDMLYKGLKGRRYLIVLDDVWGNQVWEELGIAFSDENNGSRVLLTTRNDEVGLNMDPHSAPHLLRFLSEVESWKLLQKTLFHEDECPNDLEEVGMEIAKGCKGLPLAIIAIAGILKTTEKNAVFWKQIEKDLNSHILESAEVQCMHILELSYNHLPNDLKPCFLYFAAFGEDNVVPVQKLIQLWLAEGFVRKVDDQASPEDVAESYVMNLISRSLLMAAKKGSSGRVKACKVHDMVYNLCLRKVEDENFLQYIHGYEKLFPSSEGQLDYGVDSEHPPISISYDQHRLSICAKRKHFVMLKPSGPSVRTLLYSATSDTYPRCPYDEVSFIAENFKILSILDTESINVGSSFPKGIEFLYPLRYLTLSGDIRSVPSTIAKLWNLETFVVKGLIGKVALPDTLWSMSRLRHLHVRTQAIFSLKDGSLESSSQLNNMVSLSCPAISHGHNSEEMMKLFPKLQKLRCTFSESTQNSQESIRFPVLDCLEELESLKIIYYGSARHFCQLNEVSLPLNLKKLSLSFFRLTWDDFSAIGKLPNLNILKLVSIAFDSPIWEMKDDEFKNLEYLKLESLKIVEWNAESDHLRNLQKLVLRSCIRLKEVPFSFGEIPTLEMIDLKWCTVSAEKSVVAILEQQLDYANNGFKAFINGFLADPRSSIDD